MKCSAFDLCMHTNRLKHFIQAVCKVVTVPQKSGNFLTCRKLFDLQSQVLCFLLLINLVSPCSSPHRTGTAHWEDIYVPILQWRVTSKVPMGLRIQTFWYVYILIKLTQLPKLQCLIIRRERSQLLPCIAYSSLIRKWHYCENILSILKNCF